MTEEDKKFRQGRSFKQRQSTYQCLEVIFAVGVCLLCCFFIYKVIIWNPYE